MDSLLDTLKAVVVTRTLDLGELAPGYAGALLEFRVNWTRGQKRQRHGLIKELGRIQKGNEARLLLESEADATAPEAKIEELQAALTKGRGVFVPINVQLAQWAGNQGRIPPAIVSAIMKAQPVPVNPVIARVRNNIFRSYYEQLTLKQISPEEFVRKSGEDIDKLMKESGLAK